MGQYATSHTGRNWSYFKLINRAFREHGPLTTRGVLRAIKEQRGYTGRKIRSVPTINQIQNFLGMYYQVVSMARRSDRTGRMRDVQVYYFPPPRQTTIAN